MATLGPLERRDLEELLGMGGGYVLNFSDRTFAEFVADSVTRDIDLPRYHQASNSKAHRLRKFWAVEPDHVVGRLLQDLIELAESLGDADPDLAERCRAVSARLQAGTPVAELEALRPNDDGRDFDVLAQSVRASIEAGEPAAGLDRLHTFVVRYVRVLAEREGIDAGVEKPLHSLFGELLRALRARGAIQSEMSLRILKSAISTLDSFNSVRNNQSFAHDNPLLEHEEALLIFNHVASLIRFLRFTVDLDRGHTDEQAPEGDLPF